MSLNPDSSSKHSVCVLNLNPFVQNYSVSHHRMGRAEKISGNASLSSPTLGDALPGLLQYFAEVSFTSEWVDAIWYL